MRDSPTKASQYLQNPAKSFVVWCFCIAFFADAKLEFQGFFACQITIICLWAVKLQSNKYKSVLQVK